LISGRARVVFLDSPADDIEMTCGQGLIVPKGMWHRVDILEPCQIVYATPGPNSGGPLSLRAFAYATEGAGGKMADHVGHGQRESEIVEGGASI
jgi:hypothetical protein